MIEIDHIETHVDEINDSKDDSGDRFIARQK